MCPPSIPDPRRTTGTSAPNSTDSSSTVPTCPYRESSSRLQQPKSDFKQKTSLHTLQPKCNIHFQEPCLNMTIANHNSRRQKSINLQQPTVSAQAANQTGARCALQVELSAAACSFIMCAHMKPRCTTETDEIQTECRPCPQIVIRRDARGLGQNSSSPCWSAKAMDLSRSRQPTFCTIAACGTDLSACRTDGVGAGTWLLLFLVCAFVLFYTHETGESKGTRCHDQVQSMPRTLRLA